VTSRKNPTGNKLWLSPVSPYKPVRELAVLKWLESQEGICILAPFTQTLTETPAADPKSATG
jgi:hypothetical protein